MRLAPRLVLTFGILCAASTAGLGFALREARFTEESKRFDDDVASACTRVTSELRRQLEADRKLLSGACRSGELVDRTAIYAGRDELDQHRAAFGALVEAERDAFGFDALLLGTSEGELLGADPRPLLALTAAEVRRLVTTDAARVTTGAGPLQGLVVRCSKPAKGGTIGLVAARDLDSLVARLGQTAGVTARVRGGDDARHAGHPAGANAADQAVPRASASCLFDTGEARLPVTVDLPKTELVEHLARIDQAVTFAVVGASLVALVVAVFLARSLGAPLGELATQARRVAKGDARPLRVEGSGEVAELVAAFDAMLDDLAETRRRLAATTRVAAWREVARRVAHEVKNPLAPIRAAVETLRRLKARSDPAFEEYFDEATRTVLDEVHRIAGIVTEFTRFARLPPPRPEDLDLRDALQNIAVLQRSVAPDVAIEVASSAAAAVPLVRADRDQVMQVLTNLVQNAIESIRDGNPGGRGRVDLRLSLDGRAAEGARVIIDVLDDGPGIAEDMAGRLFEPYATSKKNGTGLGLAIAQRIAIEHGGELSLVASPGRGPHGTMFRFVLPVAGPPNVEAAPPSEL